MKIDIYHHYPDNEELIKRLDAMLYLLQDIKRKEVNIMVTIKEVQDRVDAQTTVVASNTELLSGLSQMLKDAVASNDPAAVQRVIDGIDANTKALVDASIAHTPAAV